MTLLDSKRNKTPKLLRLVTPIVTSIDMYKSSSSKYLSKVEVGRVTKSQCLEVALTREIEEEVEREGERAIYIYMGIAFLALRCYVCLKSFCRNILAETPPCYHVTLFRYTARRVVR